MAAYLCGDCNAKWSKAEKEVFSGSIVDLFEQRFEANRNATAILSEAVYFESALKTSSITIQEFRDRFHRLSSIIPSNQLIGVSLEPSISLIVTIYAILKSNSSFLPLDVHAVPAERLKQYIEESQPALIIFDDENQLPEGLDLLNEENLVLKKFEDLVELEAPILPNLHPRTDLENIAAVLYTSGSTGTPKAVKIRHDAFLNSLFWRWNNIGPKPCPSSEGLVTGLMKSNITFVDGCYELFEYILQLHSLVVTNREANKHADSFALVLRKFKNIKRIAFVPSHLAVVMNHLERLEQVIGHEIEEIISDGEPLTIKLVEAAWRSFPNARIFNIYGTTETSGDNSALVLHPSQGVEAVQNLAHSDRLPIGTPISGTHLAIVKDSLKSQTLACADEDGELWVGGIQTCSYMGTTIGKFVEPPAFLQNLCNCHDISTWYRTGDQARFDSQTRQVYIQGRREDLVKIRGQKIHVSEIDAAVRSVGEVLESKSIVVTDGGIGDSRLVYFFRIREDCVLTPMQVKGKIEEQIRNKLPSYAVPLIIFFPPHWGKELPKLHSGKIDGKALLRLFNSRCRKTSATRREDTHLDEQFSHIQSLISEVLGIRTFLLDMEKSFFDNGGHSLNTLEAVEILHRNGYDISFSEFLQCTNLHEIEQLCILRQNSDPKAKSIGSKETARYVIIPFKDLDRKKTAEILADSFAYYGAFEVYLNVPRDELYEEFYGEWHQLDPDLCFGIADMERMEDGKPELLAVSMNVDGAREFEFNPEKYGDWYSVVIEVIDKVEERHMKKLPQEKGCFVMPSGDATNIRLSEAEKVRLMYLLQIHSQRLFYKLGFRYVLANNTSPVTQQIARSLGYQTQEQYKVADLMLNNGSKPFTDKAPSSQIGSIDLLEVQTVVPTQRDMINEIIKREFVTDTFEW